MKANFTLFLFAFYFCTSIIAQKFGINGSFSISYPKKDFVVLTGSFRDSQPDGEWIIYSDEQPFYFKTSIVYKNGRLNGLNKTTIAGGVCIDSNFYLDNRLNGPQYHFGLRGDFQKFETYRNDTLHGPFKNSESSGNYTLGVADGYFEYKAIYNKPAAKGKYSMGKREGQWIFEGQSTRNYVNYENDLPEGKYFIRQLTPGMNQEDTLLETGFYSKGILDGKQTRYSYYYPRKNELQLYAITEYNYENGSRHGKWRKVAFNGVVLEEGEYAHGNPTGYFFARDISGALTTSSFKFADGDSTEVFKNGKLLRKFVHRKAQDLNYYNHYDDSGLLEERDSFYKVKGKRHMDHFQYKNGKLIEEYHIVDDKRDGNWISPVYKCKYKMGVLISGNASRIPNDFDKYSYRYSYDGVEITTSDAISANENPLLSLYRWDFKKELRTDIYYNYYLDTNAIKDIIKGIRKNDTIHLHGEVIYSFYLSAYGRLISPILLQGLHPYYDKELLRILHFSTIHNRDKMIFDKRIILRFRF